MAIDDRSFLEAVAQLRGEWVHLLGDEDADALAHRMAETSLDDPASAQQATAYVLDLLGRHPPARARVSSVLGIEGRLDLVLRSGYQGPPGQQTEVAAGTWMVCPIDPSHCRKQLRMKGQRLICSEHGCIPLVPEDQI